MGVSFSLAGMVLIPHSALSVTLSKRKGKIEIRGKKGMKKKEGGRIQENVSVQEIPKDSKGSEENFL